MEFPGYCSILSGTLLLMKNLISLVVVGAFVAAAGMFFGAWTIPGLESMPTVESLGKSRESNTAKEAQRRMSKGNEAGSPASYYTTGTNSASATRNRQLQNAGKEMGVER
jgi:hypothetical protein